ncbi:MAG TPA: hypothetical protein VFD84_05115 [Candidatus Binatia bacterium]|nr:hypothetical protein [Candidatus Binatia bacterium]
MIQGRRLLVLASVCALASTAPAATPSRDLRSYVLFALDEIRGKGINLSGGNIGVNDGSLTIADFLNAASSQVVAKSVSIPASAQCLQLFANSVARTSPACGPATAFSSPLIADVSAACGFPDPFPACDPGAPVTVGNGQVVVLAPGVYGALTVMGGGTPSTLLLSGGSYGFCSVAVARNSQLFAQGASDVSVTGDLAFGPNVAAGPASGSELVAGDLRFFVAGTSVQLSRISETQAHVCAPNATLQLTEGARFEGQLVADVIRTERVNGGPGSTTTTTTTTSTTTTTQLPASTTTTASTATSTTSTSTTTQIVASTTTTTAPPGGFTRTPGFYGNHPDITQSLLPVTACGITFDDTTVGSATSALEGLCVSPHGDQQLQLIRQLLTAALNQAAGGASFAQFASCDAVCQDPNATSAELGACIDTADEFNDSGDRQPAPFPQSSANSGPCKSARGNDCLVDDPSSCP